MQPLKLTLTNFIGIRAGLGITDITIDLERLPEDSALVAITGPNGVGKTTILDNLHPYRLMRSRATGDTPGSFSFYDHVHGQEAKKTLEWAFDGRRYKTELLFKVSKSKKTDAYLFVQDGIGWQPASAPDGTVSDGKAETYDRVLASILGSPEMFFSAAFSAQNRRGLANYSNGEIKGLMSELLGTDDILALGSKASDRSKEVRIRLDVAREGINRFTEKKADLSLARADATAINAEIEVNIAMRQVQRSAVQTAARTLADRQAEANGNTETEVRRATLTRQLAGVQDRMARATEKARNDATAEEQRSATAIGGLEADIRSLGRQIDSAQAQIAANKTMQARAGEVEQAKNSLQAATDALSVAEESLSAARLVQHKASELHAEIRAAEAELAGIERDGKAMAETCAGLRSRSGMLDTVPCAGMDIAGSCPLITNAIASKKQLPEAEQSTESKRSDYKVKAAALDAIRAKLREMGDTGRAVAHAESDVLAKRNELKRLEGLVALATAIATADAAIQAAQENIAAWSDATNAKATAVANMREDTNKAIASIRADAEANMSALKEELDLVNKSLAELPPPVDTSALSTATIKLEEAERALSHTEKHLGELSGRQGALGERIKTLEQDLDGVDRVEAEIRLMEEDLSHWTLLTQALGPNGIIALTIDDAGPTLSAYANELLLACYGPRYTVSIQTQAETAKGDLKETFDIRVFDGESGDDKSIRDMSGGQKVYINEAMTRAIALYQANMHGRHYECLFSDESDGALDPEKKIQFARMKREVLKLGGYRREFFISHSEAVQECADAVIDMEGFRA